MPHLFDPLTLRSVTFPNRVFVSPMCEYSATDGLVNDWHFVHLGSRAVGGAGMVMTEATAVVPEGRISPEDLGLWSDAHIEPLARIVRFLHAQGSVAGMQLAHAGRKASTYRPWSGDGTVPVADGGWANVVAPSALAFASHYPMPTALTAQGIRDTITAFAQAAHRAHEAGLRVVEIHAAHGYLLHEFLSPLANARTDRYGGSFENRTRLLLEVTDAVRAVWPDELPLIVRISATDWADGGWTVDESVQLASLLKARGVDLIDCSSGGLAAHQQIAIGPGYQVPFAHRIRAETGVPTAAVGLITDAAQAEQVVADGSADVVLLARELLRNPRWPLMAAHALGASITWPPQYERARLRS